MIKKIKNYYKKYYTVFDIFDKDQNQIQVICRLLTAFILSLTATLVNMKILNAAYNKTAKEAEKKIDLINEDLSWEEKYEKMKKIFSKYNRILTIGIVIPILIIDIIEQLTIVKIIKK